MVIKDKGYVLVRKNAFGELEYKRFGGGHPSKNLSDAQVYRTLKGAKNNIGTLPDPYGSRWIMEVTITAKPIDTSN